jgi:hypothetical protein
MIIKYATIALVNSNNARKKFFWKSSNEYVSMCRTHDLMTENLDHGTSWWALSYLRRTNLAAEHVMPKSPQILIIHLSVLHKGHMSLNFGTVGTARWQSLHTKTSILHLKHYKKRTNKRLSVNVSDDFQLRSTALQSSSSVHHRIAIYAIEWTSSDEIGMSATDRRNPSTTCLI